MADFAFRHFQGERGAARMREAHDALTSAGWAHAGARGDSHRYTHPSRPGEKVILKPEHAESASINHYRTARGGFPDNSGSHGAATVKSMGLDK